ncbi:hypothetical protein GJ496_005237 [Pomphorhynchus laevis]|nr:hypothetical protein GJ496_005237 [Pomphorhynchus laevis]
MNLISQYVHLFNFNPGGQTFEGHTKLLIEHFGNETIFINCRQAIISKVSINNSPCENLEVIDMLEGLFHRKDTRMDINLIKRYRSFSVFCTSNGRGEITINLSPEQRAFNQVEIDIYFKIDHPKVGIYFCPNSMYIYTSDNYTRTWLPCIENQRCIWTLDFTMPENFETVVASGQFVKRSDSVKRFKSFCSIYPSSVGFAMANKFLHRIITNPVNNSDVVDEDMDDPVDSRMLETVSIEGYSLGTLNDCMSFTIKLLPKIVNRYQDLMDFSFPLSSIKFVFLPRVETCNFFGLSILDSSMLLDDTLIEPWWDTHYLLSKCISAQFFGSLFTTKNLHELWLVTGLREWLFFNFIRLDLGQNEYKWHVYSYLKSVMNDITAQDVKLTSCGLVGCCHKLDVDIPFVKEDHFIAKSLIVIRRLECKLGRDVFLSVVRKLVNQCSSKSQCDVSVSHLIQCLRELKQNQDDSETDESVRQMLHSLMEMYEFHVRYVYNKRKCAIEIEIEQPGRYMCNGSTQNKSADLLCNHEVETTDMYSRFLQVLDNSLCSSQLSLMFPMADMYTGPMTIGIQSWDEYFTHAVQIDDAKCNFEIQCVSTRHTKRNRKRKITLQNGEEVSYQFNDIEATSEVPVVFIRIDPEYKLGQRRVCVEGSSHWCDQFLYGRDVFAQFECLDVFMCDEEVEFPRDLQRLILSKRHFYKVLMSLAHVMAKRQSHSSNELYSLYLNTFHYKNNDDDTNNSLTLPNDLLSELNMYFVAIAILRSIRFASIRDADESSKCIHTYKNMIGLLIFVDDNITAQCPYTMYYFRSILIRTITNYLCKNLHFISSDSVKYLVNTILKFKNCEYIYPSHKIVIGRECIESLYILRKHHLLQVDDNLFMSCIDVKVANNLRVTAFGVIIRLLQSSVDSKAIVNILKTIQHDRTLQIPVLNLLIEYCPFECDNLHYLNNAYTAKAMWKLVLDCVDRSDQIFSLVSFLYSKMYGRRPSVVPQNIILTATDHQFQTMFEK